MIVVSRAAVKCAAQLYYSMVLGDELDVFDAVSFFTKRYLLRGGHRDRATAGCATTCRSTSSRTSSRRPRRRATALDRTRAVGAAGCSTGRSSTPQGREIIRDSIANEDFPRHWKMLMLESADYLERAQESPNPDSFVSRQKVMQAVEDLQYNLSTHCTGMANVITPLIYAELELRHQADLHPPGGGATRGRRSAGPGGASSSVSTAEMNHARPTRDRR